MRKIFLLIPIIYYSFSTSGQLYIGEPHWVCPGQTESYTVTQDAREEVCSTYEWTVFNGRFTNGTTRTFTGVNVSVVWDNVPVSSNETAPTGRLTAKKNNCNTSGSTSVQVMIYSLNNLTPEPISGDQTVSLYSNSQTYSVPKVVFPGTGVNGVSTKYADSYQWVIPSGWKLNGSTSNGSTPFTGRGESITVTPNATGGSGEKIRVFAYSNCGQGYLSDPRDLSITRVIDNLSFINPLTNVFCRNTEQFEVVVSNVGGPATYSWTLPPNWSGPTTSSQNRINVTPSGTNGGEITVQASVGSIESNVTAHDFGFKFYDEVNPPIVSGSDNLCNVQSTYTLENVPSALNTTWSVSPSNLVNTSQGSGITATIEAADSYIRGQATLTFIMEDCGEIKTESKPIWVGRPEFGNQNGISGPDNLIKNTSDFYTAPPFLGRESSEWIVPGDWTILSGQGLQTARLLAGNSLGFKLIKYRSYNPCGYLDEQRYVNVTSGGGGGPVPFRIGNKNDAGKRELSSNPITETIFYPNPATRRVTIRLKDNSNREFTKVEIINSVGKTIVRQSSESQLIEIDLSGFKAGVYFVKISESNETYVQKLVVQD